MKTLEDIKRLAELSSSQWGLFTTAQAKRVEVSRLQLSRLAEKEQIERLAFGVYRIAGAPKSQFDGIRTAWLSVDPRKYVVERQNERENGIVVGGHTAACLFDAGDLWPMPYFFITSTRKQTQRAEIVFRRRNLKREEVMLVDGIPATIPEYTVATLVAEDEDLSHIADVVFALAKKYSMNKELISALLSPYSKRYGFKDCDEAFVRYLFEGVTQSKSWEFSESFTDTINSITKSLDYQYLLKQIEPIQELMKKFAFEAVSELQIETKIPLDNQTANTIRSLFGSLQTLLDNPAYKTILALQGQIGKLLDNPTIQTMNTIQKLFESPAYKAAFALQVKEKGGDDEQACL